MPPTVKAHRRLLILVAGYGLSVVGVVALFLVIRSLGERLSAPAPVDTGSPGGAHGPGEFNALLHVLLVLLTIIVLGRALSRLFAAIHQPPVIGEVVAGILLGPSLLGRIAPGLSSYVLPAEVAPYLGVIAQVGAILYMFLVGLELNVSHLRERAEATVAISHASIMVPFLLGALLALGLYPHFSSSDVPFTHFALFFGVAMSVTAFPVLARILTDWRMSKTPLGVMALTCAATGDVTAWCLLAVVVGVAQARLGGALMVVLLTLAYILLLILIGRPMARRLAARYDEGHLGRDAVAWVFVAMLLSALATEMIGVHAIFGAFLLGAIIPHNSAIARHFTTGLEHVVTVLLLPAFFAFTGMRTQIGLVAGVGAWLVCGLIILVATAGKFGGTLMAARLSGMGWRDGAALGVLMNTRGLMELIVLNIGLDLKVISPTVFAMLVLMALVTTMATTPVLRWILGGTYQGRDFSPILASNSAEGARPGGPER